jgi:hypothetical protein
MELYLQFGHGMMRLSQVLIEEWGGGTVILSPRDLFASQLERQAKAVNKLPQGNVMVDPQFYLPHADHNKLVSHDFWPKAYSTGSFFGGPALVKLVSDLRELNINLETSTAILPGLLAQEVNADWLATQDAILAEASHASFGRPLCQTIALSAAACRTESQVSMLLEHAEQVPVESYYLICEHPNGSYLVDDPSWLGNVIDIAAGLKLGGSRVIIGYCNHQMLVAAIAKADAISSGTWLNVRSFPPKKFENQDDTKRKAVWCYAPASLSEYKLAFLDIARKVGVLSLLAPPAGAEPGVAALFAGGQPSAIGLSEPQAFMHYLTSLKRQVDDSVKDSFDATVSTHQALLDHAEAILTTVRGKGISGQLRDFWDAIAANRAAIASLEATRGPVLRHQWNSF